MKWMSRLSRFSILRHEYTLFIGVDYHLEHHPGIVGSAAFASVKFCQTVKIQTVDDTVYYSHRVILRDVAVDSFRKKNQLVVYVRAIV